LSTELPIVLDSDFLSSFAWVKRLDILEALYSGRMVVLEEVLDELRRVPHLASRIESSVKRGHIRLETMLANSPEALRLATLLDSGRYGSGEASCMAYLTERDGILASNNVADVKEFCIKYRKRLLTTADVLCQAYETGLINLTRTNEIWASMLSKRRKLPASSFTEYLSAIEGGGSNQV
jgi:predicted nucleic acid-binding protein